MKKGSDPATLFETLAAIEDQYDGIGNIKESDLIAVVLGVATQEYQAVLTAEQSMKGNQLTLHDLETVMTQHYCQINRGKSTRKEEEGEVLLTAVNGTCCICGKKATKRSDSEQNGRIHLDISSVKNHDYWRIIVDEQTQIKLSDFLHLKVEWSSLRVNWYKI
jgi:hypothetical protein